MSRRARRARQRQQVAERELDRSLVREHFRADGGAKRRYPSRSEAAWEWSGTVYRCSFCGGWHRSTT